MSLRVVSEGVGEWIGCCLFTVFKGYLFLLF